MSFQKGNKIEVEEFKFGQLSPKSDDSGEIKEWKLKELDPGEDFKKVISSEEIRMERDHEWSSGFTIDKDVREYRGLKQQEAQDFENRIEEEVNRRIEKRMKQAYEEGFRQGQEDGSAKAYEEAIAEYEQKVLLFEEFLENMMKEKVSILEESKHEAYALIKSLTKWIVLKEVEDEKYVERLLEKLILEINTKSNLLIKVNEADFSHMPEVLKNIESRLGALSNTRVEIGSELNDRGVILESEVGIIDGTLASQMKSLDKLFANVGISNDE